MKSYNGGKESDGTFQKIINLMPPHDIYIEAFLGNGAIFRNKKPAFISSIGIDLDTAVIRQWQLAGLSDLTKPAGITLINTDAIRWLENFQVLATILKKMDTRVLIYLDPPYPKESRRNMQDLYTHEMTTADHTLLLSVARSIDANVVISSYPNELYNETLKDWYSIEFTAMTRGGVATEKVWYNYPTPNELHDYRYIGNDYRYIGNDYRYIGNDYRYIGNDYREREQLKGIVTRNVSKFKRLPAVQRNAIIQELQQSQII